MKQVKEANDIVAVVGSYIALQPAGKVYKGLCPFHNDSRPSFTVNPDWQNYKCWSCGKFGDVLKFVQDFEKVDFREALEMLARRAGITLAKKGRSENLERRAQMLAVLKWAAERYHESLLELPFAEDARKYLGERKLTGETVRQFHLGFAPVTGDWLVRQAKDAPGPLETLVDVGLIAKSQQSDGFYDRFRERIMFPIRDVRGQVVGFGGRILPNSHLAARTGKYLNTNETELFKKSDLIYGLDQARLAGQASGRLAVVEGYTDVLMAHQHGVGNVVATMGTALTPLHIRQMRRYAPKVVLVYDADQGGLTGVDRALELFVREDIELAIATLPDGKDPCDLLVEQGAEPFKSALTDAADALDYKLAQVLNRSANEGVEGARRAVDSVLGILALTPPEAGSNATMKRELIVGRIAHRFGMRVDAIWIRLDEIRKSAKDRRSDGSDETATEPKAAAEPLERELLEVLLADPALVPEARNEVAVEELNHLGLRRLLEGLYDLDEEGTAPDLDALRLKLVDRPQLADHALRMQDVGRMHGDRPAWLKQIILAFRDRRAKVSSRALQTQLSAVGDHDSAVDLLRKLQQQTAPML